MISGFHFHWLYDDNILYRCSDCTTATLQGSHSVASSYGFSETDETITAETMTPNQLTLQAISTDEEDCIVDELAKDPISVPRLSREVRDSEYYTQENASISSGNESGNSIPVEKPDSRAGKKVYWAFPDKNKQFGYSENVFEIYSSYFIIQ